MPERWKGVALVSYQTQGEVEQSRAAVEQDGDQRGGGGEEQPHVSAHQHPQRLQDLQEDDSTSISGTHRVLQGSSPAGFSILPARKQLSTLSWGVRTPPPGKLACSADLTESRVSMFSCRKEAMSFQSMMSSSQLCCLCIIFWPRGRPEWVTFWGGGALMH